MKNELPDRYLYVNFPRADGYAHVFRMLDGEEDLKVRVCDGQVIESDGLYGNISDYPCPRLCRQGRARSGCCASSRRSEAGCEWTRFLDRTRYIQPMSAKKPEDDEELHCGMSLVQREDSFGVVVTRPHRESECGAAIEEAEQAMCGHETVYEAKDANSTRASVGYSKGYADNFDSAFGKN